MSIIRQTEVTLDTLVSESNLIVEVRYLGPFEEEVAIPDYPDAKLFLKKGSVFEVKNSLKNRESHVVGAIIQVPNENWKRSFSQHKEFHASGPSKSYGIKTYKTNVSSVEKAEILFLHAFHATYEFVAEHAFESATMKKQIEDLISLS